MDKTGTHINKAPFMVLASGSASRRQQLEDMGFVFTTKISGVDEDVYKKDVHQNHSPAKICQKIARAKVEKVRKEYPDALVLGGDQMAVLGWEIFNKASTSEEAIESLMKLQGKTHELFTSLYMRYQEKTFGYLEINKMHMRKLTISQIKKYVEMAKPLHCAGSYALERYGIALFEKIETTDQSAVIGFPLIALVNQLIKWGIPLPFFDQRQSVHFSL